MDKSKFLIKLRWNVKKFNSLIIIDKLKFSRRHGKRSKIENKGERIKLDIIRNNSNSLILNTRYSIV